MNLGVERFLILGCVAVLILELPQILGDLRTTESFPGLRAVPLVAAIEAPAVLEIVEPELLAKLVIGDAVALPMAPGL